LSKDSVVAPRVIFRAAHNVDEVRFQVLIGVEPYVFAV
jgi:hypothetical protein